MRSHSAKAARKHPPKLRRHVDVNVDVSKSTVRVGVREQVQLNNGSEQSRDAKIVTVPCVL